MFSKVGASTTVNDDRELAAAVLELLVNPGKATATGEKGFALLQQNRGALQRLLNLLEPTMNGVSIYPPPKASPESSDRS